MTFDETQKRRLIRFQCIKGGSLNLGLTRKQIAEQLGISELTVTTPIRNALRTLRLRLGSLLLF